MTIDQTESELALHRVLYVVKLLRAMVLHLTLAAAGAALYFMGIPNAYPVATAFIQAAQAQAIDNRLKGQPFSEAAVIIGLLVGLAGAIVLLIWMYRSLTSVRRRALRVQAALLVCLGLYSLYLAASDLAFAFGSLGLAFAVFATAGYAMVTLVVPVSVAVALLRVSRLTEGSAMQATLDARLAPNFWVYLTKLLDLPRTPLRTPRTAAAFTLAFAGALVMIASLMYLLTVGGASNKLAAARTIAEHYSLDAAIGASSVEAWRILWLLPVALAGVKAAALLQSSAKRLGGLGVSDVLTRPGDPFVLYLRPFDLDDVVLPKPRLSLGNRLFSFRPYPVRIEEELFDVADGFRPLIAVGKPGTAGRLEGGVAYRTYLPDSEWQGFVADRIRRADHVVMVIENTPGVQWEIEQVVAQGAARKTLFLFPPQAASAANWPAAGANVLRALGESGEVPSEFEFSSRPIGFYLRNGACIEIVNSNWSETSYRTAFSSFLADRSLPA